MKSMGNREVVAMVVAVGVVQVLVLMISGIPSWVDQEELAVAVVAVV